MGIERNKFVFNKKRRKQMATISANNPALDRYKNNPAYPGYAFANDARYNLPDFRQAQAKRLYQGQEDKKPTHYEAYWINVYCSKELKALAEKDQMVWLASQPLVTRSVRKISKILIQTAEAIDEKLPVDPTLRYAVQVGTIAVTSFIVIGVIDHYQIIDSIFNKCYLGV
jgi:hypothetical protein